MNSTKMDDNNNIRPRSVTLLALGVLSIAGINCLRLSLLIEQWAYLQKRLPFSPLLLASASLIVALAGISIGYGLLTGRKWALRSTEIGVICFLLYYWSDRLIIGDPTIRASSTVFELGLSLIILVYTFWALSRDNARHYFRRS